jgi:hypothetical protein
MKHIGSWVWERRDERVVRNCYLSIMAWLVMYGVFYLEVSHMNLNSQQAKLIISPLGAPLGFAIQWLVFRDRINVAESGTGLGPRVRQVWVTTIQTARHIGPRWWTVKLVSFGVNQYAYAMMLHALGLPYWLAYPAAASALGLVYYKLNDAWVFVDKWWEAPGIGYPCYLLNNLWLTWTFGSFRRTETA